MVLQSGGWMVGETGNCGQTAMLISEKLEDVAKFYDAVAEAITKGELDAPIGKMQAERSAALTGSH